MWYYIHKFNLIASAIGINLHWGMAMRRLAHKLLNGRGRIHVYEEKTILSFVHLQCFTKHPPGKIHWIPFLDMVEDTDAFSIILWIACITSVVFTLQITMDRRLKFGKWSNA